MSVNLPSEKRNSIKRLLQPKTIAVVGGALAETVIKQCDQIGFAGEIWPVHPTRSSMGGRLCYPTMDALPTAPDATFVGVSRSLTVEIIAELAKQGGGGAVCYASGFAEIGGKGLAYQKQLQSIMGNLAVVGPNCYGLLNYLDGVALWPDEHGSRRIDKGVAIIAQSGNMGISITMQQRSLPLAYVISTGNQAGVTIPEYMELLLEDKRVTAIGLHVEGLDDVVAFSQVALKALQQRVPVVVLKTGISDLGSQITQSHTSSLAGADDLYDALFQRFGVARVYTLPQLLETLKFLSIVGPLPTGQIASISCSGGEAALMADTAHRIGLNFPPLQPAQVEALTQVLGTMVPLSNPLDYHTYIWDDLAAQTRCFASVMSGEQAITLKILDYPRSDLCDDSTWTKTALAFARAAQAEEARGAVVSTLPENLPAHARETLLNAGIAPMLGIEECLLAIRSAAALYLAQQLATVILPLVPMRGTNSPSKPLDEAQSKCWLSQYQVPIPPSRECTIETAVEAAAEIGYPVALKVLSSSILHKSDVGGVRLNVETAQALEQTVADMASLGGRFLVEAMAPKPLVELIVGLTRDPQFGLALVIGAGGVLVELLQDSVTLLLPIQREDVERALGSLQIAPLLRGYRAQPPADCKALVDVIMNLARFAQENAAQLMEVDINPLFVFAEGQGVLAVDALVVANDAG